MAISRKKTITPSPSRFLDEHAAVEALQRAGRAKKIAVVVPAYNEERNIQNVLEEIRALAASRPHWRILPIVVNDGSVDRTEKVLSRIAPEYGAAVINLPLNLGIGRAVQAGFQLAAQWGADVALQLDGDGQHPSGEIPAIVEPILLGRAEVVVGSRYLKGAGGNVSSSLRQVGTLFFSWLLRLVARVDVSDSTSGFRAFSADATDFLSRCYPDDYPEVQAYVPLSRARFRISEVPVKMRPRASGRSSITPIRSVYYMLKVAFATSIEVFRPLPSRHFVRAVAGVVPETVAGTQAPQAEDRHGS